MINAPMRMLKYDGEGNILQPPQLIAPHPLPLTLAFLYDGLKKMRAINLRRQSRPQVPTLLAKEDDVLEELSLTKEPSLSTTDPLSSGDLPQVPSLDRRSLADSLANEGAVKGSSVDDVLDTRGDISGRSIGGDHTPGTTANAAKPPSRRVLETRYLWRGVRGMQVSDLFLSEGGTELAPMSTSKEPSIALRYARGAKDALIFRLSSTSFMNLGCDLTSLSAFPHEKEYLYPPLTYLCPRGTFTIDVDGTTYVVVDVTADFPS